MQVQAKRTDAGKVDTAGAEGQERLLRPAISCPGCGARPALRVTVDAVREAHRHPPEAVLGTYQCQRRRCGQVYAIPARRPAGVVAPRAHIRGRARGPAASTPERRRRR